MSKGRVEAFSDGVFAVAITLMALNLAVAGSGGGDPKGGAYPAQMLVDYVRVW